MAYNLPPAWDPGFAMPKNVLDEGLERRAFVTKQMPRGTYDDETDGTGGYDVPQYVLDEGTGQGAFVTKWQPRGTYNGPKIPHWLNRRPTVTAVAQLRGGGRQVTIQPMGDDAPLPKPFEDYGARAAQVLISRVAMLPPGKRQAALRVIMDTVDKTLWSRTDDIFRRYVRQGIPPGRAFPLALARAMSAGLAAEIIKTGLRGTAPQANSLLGLGCYGCMAALGAYDTSLKPGDPGYDPYQQYLAFLANLTGQSPTVTPPATTTPAPAPTDLSKQPLCPAPTGFSWVWDGADHQAGHWERTLRGQPDVPGPCDLTTGQTTVGQGPGRSGARVTYADGTTDKQVLQIGPFAFPAHVTNQWKFFASVPDLMITHPQNIPDDWVSWINRQITETKDADGATDTMVTNYFGPGAPAAYGFPELDAGPWLGKLGLNPGVTPVRLHNMWALRVGMYPFARLKHPTTGKDLTLHLVLNRRERAKPWDPTSNPLVMKMFLTLVPDPSIWQSVWNSLNVMVAVMRDVVVDGLTELGKLACEAFGGALGQAAGAAAATAAGAPPQAGAAGASIAQQACAKPPPPPPPVVRPSILPMVLVAGGAVVAVALLTGRKR